MYLADVNQLLRTAIRQRIEQHLLKHRKDADAHIRQPAAGVTENRIGLASGALAAQAHAPQEILKRRFAPEGL